MCADRLEKNSHRKWSPRELLVWREGGDANVRTVPPRSSSKPQVIGETSFQVNVLLDDFLDL